MFYETDFKFKKGHSNFPALKGKELVNETDQTFTEQELDTKLNETKMTGLSLKKNKYFLAMEISSGIKVITKGIILWTPVSIFDSFSIISATIIVRKIVYSDICDSKISWD